MTAPKLPAPPTPLNTRFRQNLRSCSEKLSKLPLGYPHLFVIPIRGTYDQCDLESLRIDMNAGRGHCDFEGTALYQAKLEVVVLRGVGSSGSERGDVSKGAANDACGDVSAGCDIPGDSATRTTISATLTLGEPLKAGAPGFLTGFITPLAKDNLVEVGELEGLVECREPDATRLKPSRSPESLEDRDIEEQIYHFNALVVCLPKAELNILIAGAQWTSPASRPSYANLLISAISKHSTQSPSTPTQPNITPSSPPISLPQSTALLHLSLTWSNLALYITTTPHCTLTSPTQRLTILRPTRTFSLSKITQSLDDLLHRWQPQSPPQLLDFVKELVYPANRQDWYVVDGPSAMWGAKHIGRGVQIYAQYGARRAEDVPSLVWALPLAGVGEVQSFFNAMSSTQNPDSQKDLGGGDTFAFIILLAKGLHHHHKSRKVNLVNPPSPASADIATPRTTVTLIQTCLTTAAKHWDSESAPRDPTSENSNVPGTSDSFADTLNAAYDRSLPDLQIASSSIRSYTGSSLKSKLDRVATLVNLCCALEFSKTCDAVMQTVLTTSTTTRDDGSTQASGSGRDLLETYYPLVLYLKHTVLEPRGLTPADTGFQLFYKNIIEMWIVHSPSLNSQTPTGISSASDIVATKLYGTHLCDNSEETACIECTTLTGFLNSDSTEILLSNVPTSLKTRVETHIQAYVRSGVLARPNISFCGGFPAKFEVRTRKTPGARGVERVVREVRGVLGHGEGQGEGEGGEGEEEGEGVMKRFLDTISGGDGGDLKGVLGEGRCAEVLALG